VYTKANKKATGQKILLAEKTGEVKKLENLVQNRSIGSIVGAGRTAAPRNSRILPMFLFSAVQ